MYNVVSIMCSHCQRKSEKLSDSCKPSQQHKQYLFITWFTFKSYDHDRIHTREITAPVKTQHCQQRKRGISGYIYIYPTRLTNLNYKLLNMKLLLNQN